jgi:hypothetical protein
MRAILRRSSGWVGLARAIPAKEVICWVTLDALSDMPTAASPPLEEHAEKRRDAARLTAGRIVIVSGQPVRLAA